MLRDVGVVDARPRLLAASRRRVRVGEVGGAWKDALDEVWAFLRAHGDIKHTGTNVFLYHHRARREDPMDVDFGVEVQRAFEAHGAVRCVAAHGGRALGATHVGPYDGLGAAHEAVHDFAKQHGLRIGGSSWEIYGHPTPDPAGNEVRVEYALDP